MPRFAANLTMLFTEHPVEARFDAARAAGFDAVEMLFPYAHAPETLRDSLEGAGQTLVLFNTPAHDWEEGGRGVAALPGEEARFRAEFDLALSYAEVLTPRHIHIMSGLAEGAAARDCLLANLDWATRHAPGQSLTIEPINRHDIPGYFLADFGQAAEVIAEVNAPNLALQFDAYHGQRIHGDVPGLWRRYGALTRHVQIAGVPGRHEPQGGAIDYPAFFAQLDDSGYAGVVSGEYTPAGRTEEGLAWMRATRQPW